MHLPIVDALLTSSETCLLVFGVLRIRNVNDKVTNGNIIITTVCNIFGCLWLSGCFRHFHHFHVHIRPRFAAVPSYAVIPFIGV